MPILEKPDVVDGFIVVRRRGVMPTVIYQHANSGPELEGGGFLNGARVCVG